MNNNDKKWFKAVIDGNMEVIDEMLDGDYDINTKLISAISVINSFTALMIATYKNNLELVVKLINRGADVEAKEKNGNTAIYFAGSTLMLDTLLSHGVKTKVKNRGKHTPLMIAIYNGQVEVVDWFLSYGVNVNDKGKNGMTSLHIAAEQGQLEVMNMLIEGWADIEEKDSGGKTALMYAVIPINNDHKNKKLMIEIVNKLVECGANINAKDNEGQTVLMHATIERYSSREVVERLIALGANIKEKDNNGCNAVMHAHMVNNKEIVDVLEALGEKFGRSDLNAYLKLASKHQFYNKMEKLMSNGASIEIVDNKYNTYFLSCATTTYNTGILYNLADALLGRSVDFTKMTMKYKNNVKKYLNRRYGNILMVLIDRTGNNYNVLEKIMDNYCPSWREIMDKRELYKLIETSKI